MIGSATTAISYVYVADRARGVAYYRDVLGLELVSSDAFGDLFALGGGRLRLTMLPDWQAGEHPVLGWEVGDMSAAIDALTGKGVTFTIYPGFGQDERGVWTAPDGSTELAWFADPDGNVLMLSREPA